MTAFDDARENAKNQNNKSGATLYDFASVVMTGIVIITVIFTFLFRTATVNGNSMHPTLYNGDVLMVTAMDKTHKYNDIVVITQPNSFNEPIIKRIIATGGQTVDIDFDKGVVYVDGKELSEKYVAEPTYVRESFEGPMVVPQGYVFVMGDNRNHSTDSRSSMVGLIDERYIYGTVIGRITPFGNWNVNEVK